MNMSMQPTNTTESTNLPYFCMGEFNLFNMHSVSEIATNPSYLPFKEKFKKISRISTQYYVSNTPHTDHVFELLLSFQPINVQLREHSLFKISQSVKAVHQAYVNLGSNSDGPINPMLLHNEYYVEQIKPVVDAFIYELKKHSTSKNAIADRDKRIALIKEIRKENVPVMKKLFKTHQQFNLNHFTYVFHMNEHELFKANKSVENALTQKMRSIINQFHEKHQSEILALFFCIQRDLSDNYVLNVYCATEQECQPLSMKDCISFRDNGTLNFAPLSKITMSIFEFQSSMNIQGVDGINEKIWKVIFGQQVEKYKYVYYESEFVSPKFIYIECDSKN
ncbi:hypothetical protein AB3504_02360 [Acinetobacter baumannii]|uniref:hypothetical protein n=2 Tax=Acinetobacter baumannii TaxID=470 RepID=UPI00046E261A|nr:hypothetical protein [Acinetobacter baumannii]MBD0476156.1 hypothetical protein [Acinetobacter baumannii]MBF9227286.1 hypothetical protein [Acinetobacter baumannii]MCG6633353.1 hypothetical protein [Acinetobacter baumannii]MCZ3345595.1 hypothetical protein [Acinetobacter baumannii]MDA4919184.1 hypothetical protein [Acinetobacter baumannii]